MQPIGAVLKDRNIILKGADAASARGFTQVPDFLLKSNKLSSGDKLAFAMLLSYAWQNDYCFPGRKRLGEDRGVGGRHKRRAKEYRRGIRPPNIIVTVIDLGYKRGARETRE